MEISAEGEEGEEKGETSDIQLERAIELLQGYDIFKTLEQNVTIAKEQIEPVSEVNVENADEDVSVEETMKEGIPEIMIPDSEQAPQPEDVLHEE